MKRLFTMALVLLFSVSMFAQKSSSILPVKKKEAVTVVKKSKALVTPNAKAVLFTEDFETWPPVNMSLYQLGDPAGWQDAASNGKPVYDGANSAFHNDDNVDNSCDDWMVTTPIEVTSAGTMLSFWQYENYSGWYYYYAVKVLDGPDPATANVLGTLYEGPGTEDTWEQQTASLDDYVGQTIYIGFQYTGDYADEWSLDDIAVFVPEENDLAVADINPKFTIAGNDITPAVTVFNGGVNDQDAFDINVTISDANGEVYNSTLNVTGAGLGAGDEAVYEMADVFASVPAGNYTMTATVTLAGDSDESNNTLSVDLNAVAFEGYEKGTNYGFDAYSPNAGLDDYTIYNSVEDGVINPLMDNAGMDLVMGGDWIDGVVVAITNTSKVYFINSDGSMYYYGTIDGLNTPVGLTYDQANDKVYVCDYDGANSVLYTVDENLNATLVGNVGAYIVIGIAADAQGNLYGITLDNEDLISIDPATGAGTSIGVLNDSYNLNYAQDIGFDRGTNTLYGAIYDANSDGKWVSIDVTTGAATVISDIVDEVTLVAINPTETSTVLFEDNFDAYTAGDQLACQNPDAWTTWSEDPCNATEDPYVSDAQSSSPSNSVNIVNNNDLVKKFQDGDGNYYTSGRYMISFNMYIPSGNDAYWNLMQDFGGSNVWGFEAYYNNGEGTVNANGTNPAATFTYPYDTWMLTQVCIDLDNDNAKFMIDGNVIYEWPWSVGTSNSNLLQLAAADFYGYQQTNPCSYYMDDFKFEQLPSIVVLNPPTNVQASVEGNDVTVTWDAPAGKDLTGYKVYRDGEFVANSADTYYTDNDLEAGTYVYCVSAVYDEGESEQACADPVEVTNGPTPIYEDNFDDYTAGEQVACQNPDHWTTWSEDPCNATEDAYVSDAQANSVPNSVNIVNDNDLVYPINNYTEGYYKLSFYMYIPAGNDAYWNVLQSFLGGNYKWGMQVLYNQNVDGEASVDAGGAGSATFNFNYDTWMYNEIYINLYTDEASFVVDGNTVVEWQWSTGANGDGNLNQLGGVDFYGWSGGLNANCNYYFDDFKFEELEYALPDPPTNVVATVQDDVNVNVTWDAPNGSGEGEWIHWDDGTNNDGIGLTNGGTFGVASYWSSADLAPYDGMSLTKIALFITEGTSPTVVLKAWNGSGEIYSQDVTVTPGDWNEFELDSPIAIDATQDLYFGYEITHVGGEYPAGVDAGPAVAGKGDVLTFDGGASWNTLSGYGLDYNWNLQGYVESSKDSPMVQPLVKTATSTGTRGQLVAGGIHNANNPNVTFKPSNSRDLTGYKVYRNGEPIAFVTETSYLDENLSSGEYTYCVSAVYDEGESQKVCADPVTISQPVFPAPMNLTAPETVENGNPVDLSWDAPGSTEGWIQWDDGENSDAIGLSNGGSFMVASHWMPEELAPYADEYITKILFYNNVEGASFTIKIWQGANAATELVSQDVTADTEWNEITLDNPVQIDASQELWFGYQVTHNAGEYPAGVDAGPAIQGKGDMISLDGSSWSSLYEITSGALNANWNLAAYVVPSVNSPAATPLVKSTIENPANAEFAVVPTKPATPVFEAPAAKGPDSYNVYRDGELIGNTTETTYSDNSYGGVGQYSYYVTAVYPDGESEPSNTVMVDVIVGIDENAVAGLNIYPNPAKDHLNITADEIINNVLVYNFAGQVVVNDNVKANSYTLNVSNMNPGVYMVKISTDNGSVTKRIIVK